jgi:hypothetical protein
MGKAAALRQAKLDTMEVYPSPYHWAAFTLIGDMGPVGRETPTPQSTPTGESDGIKDKPISGVCPGMVIPLALVGFSVWIRRRRR